MALSERLYEAVLGATRPLVRATALVHEPAERAVRGRRESMARLEAWGASERDPSRKLVWLHAPSVGEGLMAQGIIGALRERRPDVQVAFTHFSPSAERIAQGVGADVAGYVPWDTRGPVRKTLAALRPSALAFVRTEVWPVLTREARHAGARLLLVNAVLSEESSRLTRLGRGFLESVYRRLDGVGAVSEDHARRYQRLGVPPGAIHVTGDARFDQVRARVSARGLLRLRGRLGAGDVAEPGDVGEPGASGYPAELALIVRLLHEPGRFTLVCGSTWEPDEEALVATLGVLRREMRLRLVVAPHDPTESHLSALEERLDRAGLRHARLGALLAAAGGGAPDLAIPDAVLVDRLGILADLYALADLAYVGGGFGTAGLHSVVEPAALGVPAVFGPRHGNAREAAALVEAGGGFVVSGAGDVEAKVRRFVGDRDALRRAGSAAEAYVESESGAAGRNAELIVAWL